MNGYLFNFSASYSGGGLKRLVEYSRWFDGQGGAHFIAHPSCEFLQEQFKHNRYHFVKHSTVDRMLNRSSYIKNIRKEIGEVGFFYSYGIPISMRVAPVNWFHVSNVLPLVKERHGSGSFQRARFTYLGGLIRSCLSRCDVISAESHYSLELLPKKYLERFVLSVNGADDEISAYNSGVRVLPLDDVAVVLGTHVHKALHESYAVFKYLEQQNPGLRLLIIGNKAPVPAFLAADPQVELAGEIPRKNVVKLLSSAKFYISTTKIENSYNAAAEGIFLTHQSYISIIPPHLELLEGLPYELVPIPGLAEPLMQVRRDLIDIRNLRSWSDVVGDMVTMVSKIHSSDEKQKLLGG